MIKRIIIALFLGVNLSFAAVSNEDILNMFSNIKMAIPDTQISINKRENIGCGLEKVTITITYQGFNNNEIIYVNDDLIFFNSINIDEYKKAKVQSKSK